VSLSDRFCRPRLEERSQVSLRVSLNTRRTAFKEHYGRIHLCSTPLGTFGQELLDVALLEWEAQIIRDGAADYVRRKLVAGV
jgi:hypothetical protein